MQTVRLLFLVGCLALGACENMVASDVPVLTAADAVPEWELKPGLWTPVDNDGCRYEPSRAVRNWPDCAQVTLVEEPGLFSAFAAGGADKDYIMAQAGPDLFVVQTVTREAEPDVDFTLVTREASDKGGRATRIGFGILMCGPDAPEGTKWPNGDGRVLTLEPYPGAIPDGKMCAPDGRDGLLSLTRANREAGSVWRIRWQRAARRDEISLLRRRQAEDDAARAALFKKQSAQSTIAE